MSRSFTPSQPSRSSQASGVSAANVQDTRISEVLRELSAIVPLVEYGSKQEGGRICVVGGSHIHTGAPFFCGHAALCCGMDEVTVLTTPSAAIPIKCYSPSLNVLAELPEVNGTVCAENFIERVWPLIRNNHAFCIGPGLGHDTITVGAVIELINLVRTAEKPLVIDDDALWILVNSPTLLTKDIPTSPVILTPNKVEFNYLWGSLAGVFLSRIKAKAEKRICWEEADYLKQDQVGLVDVFDLACPHGEQLDIKKYSDVMAIQQTTLLASTIGTNITFLRKGWVDLVASTSKFFVLSQAQVSRRCRGQGAILAGLCTSFLAWMKMANDLENQLLAVYGAAIITRLAVQSAFEKKGRSMQASDIIGVLAIVIEDCIGTAEDDPIDHILLVEQPEGLN